MKRRLPSPRALPGWRPAIGMAAALMFVAALVSSSVDQVNLVPNEIGFDPDRTQLNLTPPPVSEATPSPSAAETPSTSWSPTPSSTPVDQRPWPWWRPSGVGRLTTARLPGPWKGHSATAEVTIYTPPGYSSTGSRRYPALYEAPYPYSHWNSMTNVWTALNTLIDKGLMPPVIVVAMSTDGGPYTDSECANSYDGREWFDTYASSTVITYIDSHFLTIAAPGARAILGASQGGYCAAALGSRHPEAFATSLVFSGYFHAGGDGPPANEPFGTDKAFIDAASPDVVIFNIPAGLRPALYFRLVAQPGQTLYGPEAVRFGRLLDEAGIPHAVVDSAVPHGWAQLRIGFSDAMADWAARMVSAGVF